MNKNHVVECLYREGLNGKALCVHSSYRSFGHVEGGPNAIVDALLEAGSSVMVPTFTTSMRVPPPEDWKLPPFNGIDYSLNEYTEHNEVYDPDSDSVDVRTMGAIPAAVLRRAGRRRGLHPTNSFSAIGLFAEQLVGTQTAVDIWAPLRALVDLNGLVVLMGVGYTSMTLFHLAEQQAGRPLFVRWVNDGKGNKQEVPIGSCSYGFNHFASIVDPFVHQVQVGSSTWTICPARKVVEAAAEAIKKDLYFSHCEDANCIRCKDMKLRMS